MHGIGNIGGKKKFRKVFERSELNYLSTELSFYNKLFDEDDWEAEIKLVANKIVGTSKEQLCEKSEKVKIPKEKNIFKYTFGWGSDERGSFWKKGAYEWCAYIEGELIGSSNFYVEEMGKVDAGNNPYFNAISLRTYESPAGGVEKDERTYLKSFNANTARYIVGELRFSNHVPQEWYCELFFNFYDDAGMLIGGSESFSVMLHRKKVQEKFLQILRDGGTKIPEFGLKITIPWK